MAGLIIVPNYMPALDVDGFPLPGAKMYFYVDNTTTPTTVYADTDLSTPLSNPVVSDSSGVFPAIYGPDTVAVTVTVTTALGVPLATYNGVYPSSGTPQSVKLSAFKHANDDDYTQAFIRVQDYFGSAGGVCFIDPGTYDVSNPAAGEPCISIVQPVYFVGLGAPGNSDDSFSGSVIIRHTGTSGTELVRHWNNGGSTHLVGGGLRNVTLVSNGKARHTLRITDVQKFKYSDLQIFGALTTGILIDNDTAVANPCGWAIMSNIYIDVYDTDSANATGLRLRGLGASGQATGVSMIEWYGLRVKNKNGDAIAIDQGDGNIFVKPYVFTYGSGKSYALNGCDYTNYDNTNGVYTGTPNYQTAPITASTFIHPIFARADGLGSTKGFWVSTDISAHETTYTVVDYPAGDGQPEPCGPGADCVMFLGITGLRGRRSGWKDQEIHARSANDKIPQLRVSRTNASGGATAADWAVQLGANGNLNFRNVTSSHNVLSISADETTVTQTNLSGSVQHNVNCGSGSYAQFAFAEATTTRFALVYTGGYFNFTCYSSLGAYIGPSFQVNAATAVTSFLVPPTLPSMTVSALNALSTKTIYMRAFATDAATPTFGSTVAGSGSTKTPVWYDGSNWIVG